MKSQKKEAVATPSPTTNEQAWKIVEPAIKQMEAFLASMKGSIKAQVTHANNTLADLQRRVSALEQRQGMVETKPVAKKGQAQARKVR